MHHISYHLCKCWQIDRSRYREQPFYAWTPHFGSSGSATLMIGKFYKLSIDYFDPNPAYWLKKVIFRQEIAFFAVKWPKMAFSHKWKNQFLAEISTKLEYSIKVYPAQKVVIFPDTLHKYHRNRRITLENIDFSNSLFFFDLTVGFSEKPVIYFLGKLFLSFTYIFK